MQSIEALLRLGVWLPSCVQEEKEKEILRLEVRGVNGMGFPFSGTEGLIKVEYEILKPECLQSSG